MAVVNASSSTRLHRQLDLLYVLVRRNLKVKYQGTALGFLWTLLQPTLTAILLISVFSYVVRIPIRNYWAFLISGIIVWNFLQQCINAGSFIFSEHRNVVRSIALPKELLVISAVLSRLIEFGAALLVVLAILVLVHHETVPASLLTLPVLIVFQILLAAGVAFPMAIISVWYHDVQHALPVLLMGLFYASPIFYPVSMVPEGVRSVYLINPIAQLLHLYHVALYEGKFPSVGELSGAALTCLIVFSMGYFIYFRYQSSVAEFV